MIEITFGTLMASKPVCPAVEKLYWYGSDSHALVFVYGVIFHTQYQCLVTLTIGPYPLDATNRSTFVLLVGVLDLSKAPAIPFTSI